MNYEDRSYHQLRQMYRSLPDKDKPQVSVRINNDYRVMVERSMNYRHPDWSDAELKAAVFERIYRNDFSTEEMARIKVVMLAFHQQQ